MLTPFYAASLTWRFGRRPAVRFIKFEQVLLLGFKSSSLAVTWNWPRSVFIIRYNVAMRFSTYCNLSTVLQQSARAGEKFRLPLTCSNTQFYAQNRSALSVSSHSYRETPYFFILLHNVCRLHPQLRAASSMEFGWARSAVMISTRSRSKACAFSTPFNFVSASA